MAGKFPSSRRKKKVHSEAPSIKPNENLIALKMPETYIVSDIATGQGNKELASLSVIPSNSVGLVLSSPSTCIPATQQVHVCVTKEESINSYESEYLENMSESTQSIDYDSPHTNLSFSRHIMEGRLLRPEPLEIFHQGIGLNAKPVFDSSAELVSIQPPFGDFEAVPSYRLILEQQKLAKETVMSKLDEFFSNDQVLNVRYDNPLKIYDVADIDKKKSVKMQEAVGSEPKKVDKGIQSSPCKPVILTAKKTLEEPANSPILREQWRCHVHRISSSHHRNDLSSTTSATSFPSELSVSSGFQSTSNSFVARSASFADVSSTSGHSSTAESAKKSVGLSDMATSAINYVLSLIQPSNNCCRSKRKPLQSSVRGETE
uniref:Uncharacterized protein n=1 Tax=Ditylenchus dipsaci TaxID=166011 RepID=A0A915CLY3_9BILA